MHAPHHARKICPHQAWYTHTELRHSGQAQRPNSDTADIRHNPQSAICNPQSAILAISAMLPLRRPCSTLLRWIRLVMGGSPETPTRAALGSRPLVTTHLHRAADPKRAASPKTGCLSQNGLTLPKRAASPKTGCLFQNGLTLPKRADSPKTGCLSPITSPRLASPRLASPHLAAPRSSKMRRLPFSASFLLTIPDPSHHHPRSLPSPSQIPAEHLVHLLVLRLKVRLQERNRRLINLGRVGRRGRREGW